MRCQILLPASELVGPDGECHMQRSGPVMARDDSARHGRGLPPAAPLEDQQHITIGDAVRAQAIVREDRGQPERIFVERPRALHVIGIKGGFQNAVEFRHGSSLITRCN